MSVITWDNPGEHVYQYGLDRGVLYLLDGRAVAWNGLTGLDDGSDSERKSFYLDGVKFLETVTPGDFQGTLRAYTYPDEFDEILGLASGQHGLMFHEQPTKSFSLSYRTRVGNDETQDYGYKIHILYNLTALPDSHTYASLQEHAEASEFAWGISGIPVKPVNLRPTVHISVDTRDTPEFLVNALENILYGTETEDPRLPTVLELQTIFDEYGELVIIDNGDGSWMASDLTDDVVYISSSNADEFTIVNADVTYSDPDTYDISSTDNPMP